MFCMKYINRFVRQTVVKSDVSVIYVYGVFSLCYSFMIGMRSVNHHLQGRNNTSHHISIVSNKNAIHFNSTGRGS